MLGVHQALTFSTVVFHMHTFCVLAQALDHLQMLFGCRVRLHLRIMPQAQPDASVLSDSTPHFYKPVERMSNDCPVDRCSHLSCVWWIEQMMFESSSRCSNLDIILQCNPSINSATLPQTYLLFCGVLDAVCSLIFSNKPLTSSSISWIYTEKNKLQKSGLKLGDLWR